MNEVWVDRPKPHTGIVWVDRPKPETEIVWVDRPKLAISFNVFLFCLFPTYHLSLFILVCADVGFEHLLLYR